MNFDPNARADRMAARDFLAIHIMAALMVRDHKPTDVQARAAYAAADEFIRVRREQDG